MQQENVQIILATGSIRTAVMAHRSMVTISKSRLEYRTSLSRMFMKVQSQIPRH